jgi:hypothetical protein
MGKSEGRRPLGRPRHPWEDNITNTETKWKGADSIHLAQERDKWRAVAKTPKKKCGQIFD